MRISIFLLATLLLLGSGCELLGTDADTDQTTDDPLTSLPRSLSAAERSLIQSSNGFAFDFLREVDAVEDEPNVFVSPLSASMALAMTLNGAVGATQSEMREALGFGQMSVEEINEGFHSLIALLRDLDGNVEMGIGNSLWMREGMEFYDEYIARVQEHFDATARALDFDDPGSVDVINEWVDDQTNGRIDAIIDEIAADAVLYLINAIYFKGQWTTQFDPDDTAAAPFHRSDGSTSEVQMMRLEPSSFPHAVVDGHQIIDLPYSRGAFSMTVVLPSMESSLDALVASLDQPTWDRWTEALTEQEMAVHLPRFQLEYERTLNEPLQALGMRTAFVPNVADFTGMSPVGDRLYVNEVKQKSFLDVNEEGTEAAAVTSVEVRVTSMPPSVVVDRPFLMVIREKLSGTILFVGAIGAPESP